MVELSEFVSDAALRALVEVARVEDVGEAGIDVTSVTLIPADARATAAFVAREAGVLAGAVLLPRVAEAYGGRLVVDAVTRDGDRLAAGDTIAAVAGPLRAVLAMERVALNLMTHLSGVATLTRRFTDAIEAAAPGSAARVYDTRKTLPGLRGLQKYAVACGGGGTHRLGLHDAVLIKDNHLAHLPVSGYALAIERAVSEARSIVPGLAFAMVEVDTLEQLRVVLGVPGVDVVLLDNMPPGVLHEAVAMRDELAPGVLCEASGGVTLATVGAVVATGVERISVGALTHSAVALDIGLDVGGGECQSPNDK